MAESEMALPVDLAMLMLVGADDAPALAVQMYVQQDQCVRVPVRSNGDAAQTWTMVDAILTAALMRLDVESEGSCPICQPFIARLRKAQAAMDQAGGFQDLGITHVEDIMQGEPARQPSSLN